VTERVKAIDLPRLRLALPAEIFQLPRCRSFAKALFLISLIGGAVAWGSMSESLTLRLILGICAGPFLFALASLGHEAGHQTASRWRFLNDLTGVVSMSLLGIPARGWKAKHDLHHRFGGVEGFDTDSGPVLTDYFSHASLARWLIRTFRRHEFLFWWAVPFSLWVTSWTYAVMNLRTRGVRYRRRTRWTLVDLAVSAAFFLAIGLYAYFFGWQNVLLLVAVPLAISGLVAAVCFVPNHRGMPPLTIEQARSPARYSHVHSRTVLYPWFIPANYFMNHVPWQIEHHIFPTVAGHHLRDLSPHLRDFARREGIPLTYENVFKVMPSMLRGEWLWGRGDGKLYTFDEAETILRLRPSTGS